MRHDCQVSTIIACQVPSSTATSGERSLAWVFEKLSASHATRMGLLGMSMGPSVVFKKMLTEEKITPETTVSKASGGLTTFDKKRMNNNVA